MPKASFLQSGFTTGEVSPLFYGAVKNPRYEKGLQKAQNYLATLQGPLLRRPGTKFMAAAKNSGTANTTILVPFNFSIQQAYILEFGDKYIRFYANNGQVVTSGTSYKVSGTYSPFYPGLGDGASGLFFGSRSNNYPQYGEELTVFTSVSPGSILEIKSPYSQADLPLLRWAQNADTLYIVHPNYPPFKIQRQGVQDWRIVQVLLNDGPYLAPNTYASTGDGTQITLQALSSGSASTKLQTGPSIAISNATSGSGGQILITTSSAHNLSSGAKIWITGVVGTTEANNYDQTGPSFQTHPAYWQISVVDSTHFLLLGSVFATPYVSGGTIYPALFAISAALQQPYSISGGSPVPPDVGRSVALVLSNGGSKRYTGIITFIYNAATVGVNVYSENVPAGSEPVFPVTTPSLEWFLGTFYGVTNNGVWGVNTTAPFLGGQPRCVTFHQNRLCFAGAATAPQEFDASNTGDYENFQPSDPLTLEVADNNALSFQLTSSDVNAIFWMKSTAQGLLCGNASAEWALSPSSASEALTPTNFNALQIAFYGSSSVDAVQLANGTLYMQRAQRKLREMNYFFQVGTFRSTDLSEISEHLTIPQITQLAVQKETQPIIWGVRSDGVLTSMMYNRDDLSLSVGWSPHLLGGQSDPSGTQPLVKSIAVIPDPTAAFDQLWLVVTRYINGVQVTYIEYLTNITNDAIAQEDSFQLDCGITYSGMSPVTTVSGLTFLEGETVGILTDGGIHPDVVVSNSGVITLNYPATKVQIGYRFKSKGQLLRIEAGAADGTSIGKTRRTHRVAFQLHRTGDLSFGTDFNSLIPIDFAQSEVNNADQPVPLFSGMIREGVESAYDFESEICFQQDSPLPGIIQSITSFLEEFDV